MFQVTYPSLEVISTIAAKRPSDSGNNNNLSTKSTLNKNNTVNADTPLSTGTTIKRIGGTKHAPNDETTDVPSLWKNNGQNLVLHADGKKYEKTYFACKTPGCPARKDVHRVPEGKPAYRNSHNHQLTREVSIAEDKIKRDWDFIFDYGRGRLIDSFHFFISIHLHHLLRRASRTTNTPWFLAASRNAPMQNCDIRYSRPSPRWAFPLCRAIAARRYSKPSG